MIDCTDLIDGLHEQACVHVHLATLAEAVSVAAMHIELAVFSENQARVAEEFCEDA